MSNDDLRTFYTPSTLIENRISVMLIGAGGSGSEMLDVLARIHHGLIGVGHPGGLHVTVMDGDEVCRANVGRQRFSPQDIGINKSTLLVHRYNLFYGLDWDAIPRYWSHQDQSDYYDIWITCVDRASTRVEIADYHSQVDYEDDDSPLWLDCGNGKDKAQVILGHLSDAVVDPFRLPNVYDLFPELCEVDDNDQPSCSLAEALQSQDLMINRIVADSAGAILWKLLREGKLTQHGAFIDLQSLSVQPLLINAKGWEFFGYQTSHLKAA